ncbi:MAG: flagellar protein FlaG [Lachnospiraceae bacterium]|nr:flagellar protein FlaG [Lachnospiraceae bacterium]
MALESIKRAAVAASTPQINRGSQDTNVRKVESRQTTAGVTDYADAQPVQATNISANNEESGSPEQEAERARKLKAAISHANSQIKHSGRTNCEFSYNEEINRIAIKVIDSETKEVIREIPAEETLKMVEKMYELAGILVDERR